MSPRASASKGRGSSSRARAERAGSSSFMTRAAKMGTPLTSARTPPMVM